MGCGSSQATSVVAPDAKEDDPVASKDKAAIKTYPPAEAFEVPLDDDFGGAGGDQSIIKKHPPKRLLQRLGETPNTVPTTIEDLEEKLANAEIRRNKFLQQRVERIKESEDTESTGMDELMDKLQKRSGAGLMETAKPNDVLESTS